MTDLSEMKGYRIVDAAGMREAMSNGCAPIWSNHYFAWCCGCDDLLHACDQQCSLISESSAKRRRVSGGRP